MRNKIEPDSTLNTNHAAYWHERIAYHSKQIEKCERELRELNNRRKKDNE